MNFHPQKKSSKTIKGLNGEYKKIQTMPGDKERCLYLSLIIDNYVF